MMPVEGKRKIINGHSGASKGSSIHKLTQEARENIELAFESECFIKEVDKHYYFVAKCVIITWIALSLLSYYLGYMNDSLESLSGIERKAPLVACLLLGMSCLGSVLPMVVRGSDGSMSGVLVCARKYFYLSDCIYHLTEFVCIHLDLISKFWIYFETGQQLLCRLSHS